MKVNFLSYLLFRWTLLVFGLGVFVLGCENAGVQSGSLLEEFGGVQAAESISPTSVRLTWNLEPRFASYKIYRQGVNNALKNEIFATTIINGLSPSTEYSFSVTGVDKENKEEGVGNFKATKTLGNFTGIAAQNVVVRSASQVDLTWQSESSLVTYLVYVKKEGQDWNFSTPANKLTGQSTASITGLVDGTSYCFYVVANYLDGTTEPSTDDIKYVNSKAPCFTTLSSLQGVPVVALNAVIPGNYPWFVASGGQADMTIDIFDKATNTRVASRTGDGVFRSFVPIDGGVKQFSAVVSKIEGNNVKRAVNDVQTPGGATKVNIRAPIASGALGPLYPRLISNGSGVQSLGKQIVRGDFNCDGLPDVAVSAPTATPFIDLNHVSGMGGVIIFYTYAIPPFTTENPSSQVVYKLKTNVAPSPSALAPNPQIIYYPVAASDYHLGDHLAVGNFNGDCARFGTTPLNGRCDTVYSNTLANPALLGDITKIYKCDDLAISATHLSSSTYPGDVYVVYGSPSGGLISGSGGTNYGLNEATCDPSTGSCRSVKMNHTNTSIRNFGKSLATGDFNNDGFDDLVIGSNMTDVTGALTYPRVTVLRGSSQGVLPMSSTYSFPEITAEGSNVYAATADLGKDTFATSTAPIYNSRLCNQRNGTFYYRSTAPSQAHGFDFTKCDDLVIGDPGRNNDRGSIVVCKGGGYSTGNADEMVKTKITSWTCSESWPDALEDGAQYGASLLGVENQNGYPIIAPSLDSTLMPNVTGALFVGAPAANYPYDATVTLTKTGLVFGYYMTPASLGGGFQGVIGTGAHTIGAINVLACDRTNTNLSNHCDHQVVYPGAPQESAAFGANLSRIEDSNIFDKTRNLPSLAISAPNHNVIGAGGVSYTDNGIVYVYKTDLSVLGLDNGVVVTAPQQKAGACGANCNFFGGGLSPFGPSILYPSNLQINAHFGAGGVAGDNYDGLGNSDVIASSPDLDSPVAENGGVFGFLSSGGNFAATQTNPEIVINSSYSKEVNYHFEMAKSVGDINGDGYDDVLARIRIGSNKNELALFYGSASGLVMTPDPSLTPTGLEPRLIKVSGDKEMGRSFHRIGSINGDAFDDILVVGAGGSYIYYGSSTGLVTGAAPSVSPVGKNPLWFARPGDSDTDYVNFYTDLGVTESIPSAYEYMNQGVAFGDFNGDGYGDFAISTKYPYGLPSGVDTTGIGDFSLTSAGRVFVIYGSDKGPQLGTQTGYLRVSIPGDAVTPAEVTVRNPCTLNSSVTPAKSVCKVQILSGATGVRFGYAAAGVPTLDSSLKYDGMLVSDPYFSNKDGVVYYYRGGSTGIDPVVRQTFVGHESGHRFGSSLSYVGDINGDQMPDIAISAPFSNGSGTDNPSVYVFYSKVIAGVSRFYGASSLVATDYWTTSPTLNAMHSSSSDLKPQVIRPSSISLSSGYGVGLAGGFDFNNDGYADVVVNMAFVDYNLDESIPQTGAIIVFFGGPNGLRTLEPISTNPKCYGDATSFCDPYEVFLPGRTTYENTFLSSTPLGDFNGDGLTDILVGGVGRAHPSGKAFSTGVIYVVY